MPNKIFFLAFNVAWILATSAVSALAQFGGYKAGNSNIDKIVARIDNHIVLRSELDLAIGQLSRSKETPPGTNMRCKALESLVVSKLMLAKAELDSITVEEKMVSEQLDRRMQYMIQTIGTKEKLEAYYKKTIEQLKSDLRKQLREQMLGQKVQEGITKDIKITPAQVRRFYETIPVDSLPYFSTEVEIGQIVIEAKVGKNQKQIAKQTLEEIRNRILKGESFGDLAKQYSQDPGSAEKSGELGFWAKGAMVPEYEKTALRLKPGVLSEIIESQFGFHLIELIEIRGNEYNSRHILIKPSSSATDLSETRTFLDSLRNAIVKDSITFQKAANKFSADKATKETGGFFSDPNTNTTRIATENLDPVVYFTIDTMQVGGVSNPLPYRLENGNEALRIIWYKSKTPPHQANLKDDYQKILFAALQAKKGKIMDQWFVKTRKEVYINIDPDYLDCNILPETEQGL